MTKNQKSSQIGDVVHCHISEVERMNEKPKLPPQPIPFIPLIVTEMNSEVEATIMVYANGSSIKSSSVIIGLCQTNVLGKYLMKPK